jgi:hypothetical protein
MSARQNVKRVRSVEEGPSSIGGSSSGVPTNQEPELGHLGSPPPRGPTFDMSIVRNYYSAFIYARDGRYVEPDVAPGLVLSRISAVMGRRTIQLEGIVDERIIGLLPQLKTRNGPGKILHKGLRKYDVVLTTYEVMKSNLKNCMIARNALCGLTWDRIVLDEAHRIRNKLRL